MASQQEIVTASNPEIPEEAELLYSLGLVDGQLNFSPEKHATQEADSFELSLFNITRLGHRDEYPHYYDWMQLLPAIGKDAELLWIVHSSATGIKLYLGFKSPKSDSSANSLKALFESRCFPDTQTSTVPNIESFFDTIDDYTDISLITGMPSLKTLKRDEHHGDRVGDERPQACLNDIVEAFPSQDYCIVFSLSQATAEEMKHTITNYTRMRDRLSPHLKRDLTLTKGEQEGQSENTTIGETTNDSEQAKSFLLKSLWQMMLGTKKGQGPSGRFRPTVSFSQGRSVNHATDKNSGTHTDIGITCTETNSLFQLIDENLDLKLQLLREGIGSGGFFASARVYAKSLGLSEQIARSIAATLSGSHTHICPFRFTRVKQIDTKRRTTASFIERTFSHTNRCLPSVPLLNTENACQFLPLPEADLFGVELKHSVFYGRPNLTFKNTAYPLALGEISGTDKGLGVAQEFKIPDDELSGHILVTGTTGSGKTMRAASILNQLISKPLGSPFRIIALETAKMTYRNLLGKDASEFNKKQVYTLGDSSENPFRINPFYFENGTSLKRHISVLSDALAELLPVEALIGPKLREAVQSIYRDHGWNIETGLSDSDKLTYPTVLDFNLEIRKLCNRLNYSPELNQNYRGAMEGRSRLFIDDLYQDIFSVQGNQSIEDLFSTHTILEMDKLPPSEIQMPAFVISILFERLRAYRTLHPDLHYKHVIVIEEAHNVLSKQAEASNDQRQAGRGKHLLDQTVRLLQEGRELGIYVMVVDQSPSELARAVIQNTNTKIVHRIEDPEDVEMAGSALGIDEKDTKDLHALTVGECVVRTRQTLKPVKLMPVDEDDLPGKTSKAGQVEKLYYKFPDKTKQFPFYTFHKTFQEIQSAGTGAIPKIPEVAHALLKLCGQDYEFCSYSVNKFKLETDNEFFEEIEITSKEQFLNALYSHVCKPSITPQRFIAYFFTRLFTEEFPVGANEYCEALPSQMLQAALDEAARDFCLQNQDHLQNAPFLESTLADFWHEMQDALINSSSEAGLTVERCDELRINVLLMPEKLKTRLHMFFGDRFLGEQGKRIDEPFQSVEKLWN